MDTGAVIREVAFTLTADDLVNLYTNEFRASTKVQRSRVSLRFLGGVVPTVIGASALIKILTHHRPAWQDFPVIETSVACAGVAFGIGFLIWHVWYCQSQPARIARRWQRARRAIDNAPMRVALTAECLVLVDRETEIRLGWRYVGNVHVSGDHIVFPWYAGTTLIPRRFFADDSDFTEFANTAARLKAAAPQIAGDCPACGYDLRGLVSSGCPECGWRREGSVK